ncbi:MAG: DUF3108 domain-containing protein [Acidobacteriota bacterium]
MLSPLPRLLIAAVLSACFFVVTPLGAEPSPSDPASLTAETTEEFHYRWRLGGFAGRLAGMFLPSKGDGVLTFENLPGGRLESDLLITSEEGDDGEFWRYGSLIDTDNEQALRAWSSYRWRGEEKERGNEVEEDGVLDVVSGIWMLRRDRPTEQLKLTIWSDGKLYPVLIEPEGTTNYTLGDRLLRARKYTIRGDRTTPGRPWKGRLELWFTDDEAAMPVEIRIARSLADLRLKMVQRP